MYALREKAAYSLIGKQVAKVLRVVKYKNERLHWIQQRLADLRF